MVNGQDNHRATIPNPVLARRSASGAPVRIAYAAGILLLGVYLAWYFGRSLLFLEGPGTVSAPLYMISTPYLSQVVHMNVAPGLEVVEGDLLALLVSPEFDKEVNELDRILLEQSQTEAELRIRLRIANATREAAKDRLRLADEAFDRLGADSASASSLGYQMDVYRERSLAAIQTAEAEAEADETEKQIGRLLDNQTRIEAKIAALQRAFADGQLTAPIDGLVGARISHSGEVIPPGQPVADIYDLSERYIAWNVPAFSIRSPKGGDVVYVHYGSNIIPAYVVEIQQISTASSAPNQSILREKPQMQVIIVKTVADDVEMPIGAPVTVRMNYSGAMDAIFDWVRGIME